MTGLLIGWRIRSSVLEAVAGFLLLLLFAYAISWIMAYVGLLVRVPEVFNNAAFIVIFPLTFVANTFVTLENLPGPAGDLRAVEPGLHGDPGRSGPVRQHPPGTAPHRALVDGAPHALHTDLGGGHRGCLRAALDPPIPAHRQSVTGPAGASISYPRRPAPASGGAPSRDWMD